MRKVIFVLTAVCALALVSCNQAVDGTASVMAGTVVDVGGTAPISVSNFRWGSWPGAVTEAYKQYWGKGNFKLNEPTCIGVDAVGGAVQSLEIKAVMINNPAVTVMVNAPVTKAGTLVWGDIEIVKDGSYDIFVTAIGKSGQRSNTVQSVVHAGAIWE